MKSNSRLLMLMIVVGLGWSGGAQAQSPVNFYWTNTASGVQGWNAANWTNSAGAGVTPANGGDPSYILNFSRDATYTASNDFSTAPFVLNGVSVKGMSVARPLTLNGDGLLLTNNGSLLPTITNGSGGSTAVYFDMPLTLATNTIVLAANNCSISMRAAVGGAGGLIVSNESSGIMALNVNNTFAGGIDVSGGILRIKTAESLGSGILTLRAGTVLHINPAAGITVTNDIVVAGVATVNNEYSGGENYTGRLSGNAMLSITNLGINVGTNTLMDFGGALEVNLGAASATLRLYHAGLYGATNATLSLKSGTLTNTAVASINLGALTGTTNGYINLGTNTLTVGYLGQTNTFAGTILGGAKLVKVGAGMLVLSGVNTFTNTTTVSNGTLSITGTLSNSPITVVNGGTLAGTGLVVNVVANAGHMAPGVGTGVGGIGTLVASNVTWNGESAAGSSWIWDADPNSAAVDRLFINGNFSKGTGSAFCFDFRGGALQKGTTYTLVEWTGTSGFAGGDFSTTNVTLPGTLGSRANFLIESGVTNRLKMQVVSPTGTLLSVW
jgi:autotransporter-associated beta strand protein